MKSFDGRVLFLDRGDINTDEIIPAKYLSATAKVELAPHCLEDLKLPSFDPRRDISGKSAIVARQNFGCGSSREHAPWALDLNGIRVVAASSFARIFRGNMFNGGLLAIELAPEAIDGLFRDFAGSQTVLKVDWAGQELAFEAPGLSRRFPLGLGDFERALIEAGGWVEYASAHY
jgi:3-isopropylmalate/(R)-2-methylmalate dehydratase small subunit